MAADKIGRLTLGLLLILGSVVIAVRRIVFLARLVRSAQPSPHRDGSSSFRSGC